MSLEIVTRLEEPALFHCLVCGVGFSKTQTRLYQDHVVRCSGQNEELLREMSFRHKAPHLFDPLVAGDVELSAWIRANSRAILEGRRII